VSYSAASVDINSINEQYQNEFLSEEIYCGVKRRQKKTFKRNKKEYERLSEHIGLIPLVLISPSDGDLIRGGSEERRKFVDMLICQYDRAYLQALIRYNQALRQRNSYLREQAGATDDSLFDIWDDQLVAHSEIIHLKRKELVDELSPIFQQYHQTICKAGETVSLQYESQLNDRLPAELLRERREKDKILGYTSCGIHKDDFNFLLDNYLIRKVGSQGQNKTYLIALKLAQFNLLVRKGSSLPLLLLDDIFDKLDADRVKQIMHLVAQPEFGQIFITDTNRKYLDEILEGVPSDYKLFQVNNGVIKELQ
jgi:DNA replication and repair protein RecF